MELPKQAIGALGLEKIICLPLEEATNLGLLPIGIDILSMDYEAVSQKSDHYLLRDAPYSVVRGECKTAYLRRSKPDDATHYSLGPPRDVEYVAADRNRSATYTSYLPIVFWKIGVMRKYVFNE